MSGAELPRTVAAVGRMTESERRVLIRAFRRDDVLDATLAQLLHALAEDLAAIDDRELVLFSVWERELKGLA